MYQAAVGDFPVLVLVLPPGWKQAPLGLRLPAPLALAVQAVPGQKGTEVAVQRLGLPRGPTTTLRSIKFEACMEDDTVGVTYLKYN